MYQRLRLIVLVLLAVFMPTAVPAQQANADSVPAAGPRVDVLTTGVRAVAAPADTAQTLQQRQSMGKPVALMVVGGAAVVLGALIGDDIGTIFMIGGAVALLIGLYQYLR